MSALYELSLFDAADSFALDREYDVGQYKAQLATAAAQRKERTRPATAASAVKEAEEQKTNDEQPAQQPVVIASPAQTVTNICSFDLKRCAPPRVESEVCSTI